MNKFEDFVIFDEEGKALIRFQKKVYEREALFAAAEKHTDRCTIFIQSIDDFSFGVSFLNPTLSQNDIKQIAEEFCNEALDQQVRYDLEKRNGRLRELIVRHAFSPLVNLEEEVKLING